MLKAMRVFAILFVFLCQAAAISAGPWPREKGQVFLSFSSSLSTGQEAFGEEMFGYHTVYLEYGLTPALTFGADAGTDGLGMYQAVVFLRRPLPFHTGAAVMAVQGGIGLAEAGAGQQALVQAGLSWGRGFETRLGAGWAVLDAQLLYRDGDSAAIAKADLTLGLAPGDRTKVMVQLQSGEYPEAGRFLRVAPGAAYEISPGAHIEAAVEFGVVGDDRIGVKLGTWLEF